MAGVKGRSGGSRPNCEKPRTVGSVRWQREQRKLRRGGGAAPPAVPPVAPPSEPVSIPACLVGGALVWTELAPKAIEKGTLTPATAAAFALLCQNVALERQMRAAELGAGVGGPDHRGMIRLVELGLERFGLNANGKPAVVQAPPDDAFSEFEGPVLVKGAGL